LDPIHSLLVLQLEAERLQVLVPGERLVLQELVRLAPEQELLVLQQPVPEVQLAQLAQVLVQEE
jgi:hypothetical protein